jgi:hypothetical protein
MRRVNEKGKRFDSPPAYPVQSPCAKTTCLNQLLPSNPSWYKNARYSILYL